MNNPLTAVLDGLSVAGAHWRLVTGILLILVVSQVLLYLALKRIFGEKCTASEYYALSLAGWLLPASLLSLLWYAGAGMVSPAFNLFHVLVVLALVGSAISVPALGGTAMTSRGTVVSLLLLTILLILLRLAFVSKVVVPLYFDSAQHYRFIKEILLGVEGSGLKIGAPADYYHMGFHLIAAFITSMTGANIADTMLVLGQVILAVMPFSVFFLVRHVTRSNRAGVFGLALAAFGWYMPAHAMDWGKYPALASLALIPFVLGAAYLSTQNKNALSRAQSRGLNALLLAGALVSVLLHSRSAIVFVIAALAWGITSVWKKPGGWSRFLFLALITIALVAEIIFIQRQGILGPLFDAYGVKAVVITISVLFLSIFAYRNYPGLVFSCILFISLLLASLFIPLVDLVPGYATTTLLDRPFVQMILYLPLALLGGFGLAGLEQRFGDRKMVLGNISVSWRSIPAVFFTALVIVHALFTYDLYPSECCDIVSEDDLAAIRWMDENLPAAARILISSTELNVLPTDEFQGSAGGDAGAWITPLIGRISITMPFNTDFSQQQTLDALCRMQVDYVYVGKTGSYFDESGMPVQPDGYKIVFALPKARVYQVTGCG